MLGLPGVQGITGKDGKDGEQGPAGQGIPEITPDSEGKVLSVENQVSVWKKSSGGGQTLPSGVMIERIDDKNFKVTKGEIYSMDREKMNHVSLDM